MNLKKVEINLSTSREESNIKRLDRKYYNILKEYEENENKCIENISEKERKIEKYKQDKSKINDEINFYRSEIKEKIEKDLEEAKNRKKREIEEFEALIKNMNFIKRIYKIIIGEIRRKRAKIQKSNDEQINFQQNRLETAEEKIIKKELAEKFIENEKILNEIEKCKKEKNKAEQELEKINLYKKYIEENDKEKVDYYFNYAQNIIKSDEYPSKKTNRDIGLFLEKIKTKYNIEKLEDKNLDYLIKKSEKLESEELRDLFIKKELIATEKMLSEVDGKSLDKQQRLAVIIDEDNNLVIAGAGSGKTLTIAAKVKYLIKRKNINPRDILLISYTRKAALEMENRINKKLGLDAKVKTYHALGLEIIRFYKGNNQEIFSSQEMNDFMIYFKKEVIEKNKELKENLFKYFATYMHDYVNPEQFDCIGEYYRLNKAKSLKTIKNKLLNFNKEKINEYINDWLEKTENEDDIKKALFITREELNSIKEKINKCEYIDIKNKVLDIVKEIEKWAKNLERLIKEKDVLERYIETEFELGKNINNIDITNLLKKKKRIEKLIKDNSEEIIKRKIIKMQEEKISYSGIKVKSIEELIIANYLFINSIEYDYEKEYKYNIPNYRKQYRPDFYLPEADIYIEHFGINEEGRCPQYSEIEEKKYLKGIQWKRAFHEKNKTKMEETYSYEHRKGILIKKINAILDKYNIKRKKLSADEITCIIKKFEKDNETQEFYKLLQTFLNLFKANNLKIKDIEKFIDIAEHEENIYMSEKHTLFLKIFKVFYLEYCEQLKKVKKIDFNDMINEAIKLVKINGLPEQLKYKYIIIDEFQDVSYSKYSLIKCLKEECNSKVVAVGDDWQSIFRFTGSEISIFTKFAKYFGETEVLKIEKTYRNSQNLIDIASEFVEKNPNQIKKNLKSDKVLDKPVVIVNYNENYQNKEMYEKADSFFSRLINLLANIDCKKTQTVLFLGRNNSDLKIFINNPFFKITKKNGEIKLKCLLTPELDITFMTIHRSKGTESDVVFILNNNNSLSGFPNKIVEDSIISYVIRDDENFLYAEERRLFYVALTRTKSKCYLMSPIEHSLFIHELQENKNVFNYDFEKGNKLISCPSCKSGYIKKRKNKNTNKYFYGCNYYPQCSFSVRAEACVKSLVRCPKCDGIMILRNGQNGYFYGCTNYPTCNGTYSIEKFKKLEQKYQDEQYYETLF